MMKAIGGFFELETHLEGLEAYHTDDALFLNTGRACISTIIQQSRPSKVYLPFLCCDSVIAPFEEYNVEYVFYAIDKTFMPTDDVELEEGAFFLYINYYGLQQPVIEKLYAKYGERLIVDNVHSFYSKQYKDCYSYNSARKFFGVPDGAYLYGSKVSQNLLYNERYSTKHIELRSQGMQEEAYKLFVTYEQSIDNKVFKGSRYSEDLLGKIDYDFVARRRIENFYLYHNFLQADNTLSCVVSEDVVPFVYPYLPGRKVNKPDLFKASIFVATYWPDVFKRRAEGFELEIDLAENVLALPIDHRYSEEHILYVINQLKTLA